MMAEYPLHSKNIHAIFLTCPVSFYFTFRSIVLFGLLHRVLIQVYNCSELHEVYIQNIYTQIRM